MHAISLPFIISFVFCSFFLNLYLYLSRYLPFLPFIRLTHCPAISRFLLHSLTQIEYNYWLALFCLNLSLCHCLSRCLVLDKNLCIHPREGYRSSKYSITRHVRHSSSRLLRVSQWKHSSESWVKPQLLTASKPCCGRAPSHLHTDCWACVASKLAFGVWLQSGSLQAHAAAIFAGYE